MMVEELRRVLEQNRAAYYQVLSDLIALDTQTKGHGIDGGNEKNGQVYLEKRLRDMGFEIILNPVVEELIQQSIAEYGEGNPGHNNDDRYNVIGTLRGTGGGRSIMLNGHMDTMPIGNTGEWKTDPLVATNRDGRIFGLGTSDMKAGLAAAVCAVQLLQDVGIRVRGDIRISSVVDEEGGGNGSIVAALCGHTAEGVVVCEPTDCRIVTANMGFFLMRVAVRGVSLHAGLKAQGINAIEKVCLLLDALTELEKTWVSRYSRPSFSPPSINVGVINGGTVASAVPDFCEFKLCLHYIPGVMNHEEVLEEITNVLRARAQADEWLCENPPEISVYQAGRAFDVERDSPFVESVYRSANAALNDVEFAISSTGNDARIYQHIAGVPVVIFGPGHAGKGHRPNEFIELENFYKCILAYARIIMDWCV